MQPNPRKRNIPITNVLEKDIITIAATLARKEAILYVVIDAHLAFISAASMHRLITKI